jgi:Mce-associated membrane protein
VKRHRLPNRGNKANEAAGTAEEVTETASGATELTEPAAPQSESADVDEPAEEAAEASSEVEAEPVGEPEPVTAKRGVNRSRVFAFGVLPAVALLLALGAGYLKWQDNSVRNSDIAAIESVQVAKDSTVAMLSYKPDTVEQQLNAARKLLTGEFQESYTGLINDVVIPGAKEKQISAVASAPAAASVSAEPNKAVVLVFVNQTVAVGQDPPTDTASSVRVTLEKTDGHWLISTFDPI